MPPVISAQKTLNQKFKACDSNSDGLVSIGDLSRCDGNSRLSALKSMSSAEKKAVSAYLEAVKDGLDPEKPNSIKQVEQTLLNASKLAPAGERWIIDSYRRSLQDDSDRFQRVIGIEASKAIEMLQYAEKDFRHIEANEVFRAKNLKYITGIEKVVGGLQSLKQELLPNSLSPEQVTQIGSAIDPNAKWAEGIYNHINEGGYRNTMIALRKKGELPSVYLRVENGKLQPNDLDGGKLSFALDRSSAAEMFVQQQVADYFRSNPDVLVNKMVSSSSEGSSLTPGFLERYGITSPNVASQISRSIKEKTGLDVELILTRSKTGVVSGSYIYRGLEGLTHSLKFDPVKRTVTSAHPNDYDGSEQIRKLVYHKKDSVSQMISIIVRNQGQ